ncbi:MAG: phage baseplate assembly protein V [Oscillibacter sp.]
MENGIRVGKVSAIDYTAGTVRVVYHDKDDAVTTPMPLLADEYNMPQVGDQVVVLHLSNGKEAGLVLGRVWSEKHKPAESGAGLYRKELDKVPGAAMIRYKKAVLTLKADGILASGNVAVVGGLTVDGNLIVKGSLTVAGTATATTVTADSISASGDVVAGGISLKNHTHADSMGGNTTPPK